MKDTQRKLILRYEQTSLNKTGQGSFKETTKPDNYNKSSFMASIHIFCLKQRYQKMFGSICIEASKYIQNNLDGKDIDYTRGILARSIVSGTDES